MDLETFQSLPAAEVARRVRAAGGKVCAFPINGTRRWFMLEHQLRGDEDFALTYYEAVGRRHIELYRLLFDHGIDTLLTPVFGPDLAARGDGYMRMASEGLARLATHPDFLDFYDAYAVRVRFYGDYRAFFAGSPYADVPDRFDAVTARTAAHDQRRLFFGVCAHDATETVAALAIRYHAAHGRAPDKRALIEMYYGEDVPPVDFFIGFDRFCVFDAPLVLTGNEDLYFTVSPSPYLDERQLRAILYDHLYARRGGETDYADADPEAWALMGSFYRANRGRTLGVGARHPRAGFWYPTPQVELPPGFAPDPQFTSRQRIGEAS